MTDFYSSEYRRLLQQAVGCYSARHRRALGYDGADLSGVVSELLIRSFLKDEHHYVECRKAGKDTAESMQRVDRCLAFLDNEELGERHSVGHSHAVWSALLHGYEDCTLVYADDSADIVAKKESLNGIAAPLILISLDEMPDHVCFPDNAAAIRLEPTPILKCDNSFLRLNFPTVHKAANSIAWLLSILTPSKIINLSPATVTGMIWKQFACHT